MNTICPNQIKVHPLLPATRHKIAGKGIIVCKKCKTRWCCCECAVECDALDHKYFDMIWDSKSTLKERKIVCCKCSGNKPSWMER